MNGFYFCLLGDVDDICNIEVGSDCDVGDVNTRGEEFNEKTEDCDD